MAVSSRSYDIVLFGVTGFTGGLVAEYFFEQHANNNKVKFAFAGRTRSKLEQLVEKLNAKFGGPKKDIPLVIASSDNKDQLNELANSTRVVLTTVGPYALYGEPLVEACVTNKTHYCDLTGESAWVRSMIDKYHDQACRNGVKLVFSSGFDSIPSDLGSLMVVVRGYSCTRSRNDHVVVIVGTPNPHRRRCHCVLLPPTMPVRCSSASQDHIKKTMNEQCRSVEAFFIADAGASGGTLASVMNMTNAAFALARNPFLLNPGAKPSATTPRTVISSDVGLFTRYSSLANAWITPFMMAVPNTRVVRRTASLKEETAGESYGSNFEYNEYTPVRSFFTAQLICLVSFIGQFVIGSAIARSLLKRIVPQPGSGPSAEKRAKSWFHAHLVGVAESSGDVVYGEVAGGDPGYGETSKMISETALCLAFDQDTAPKRSGCLTVALACGMPLIERLRNCGLVFRILTKEDDPADALWYRNRKRD
eukprot:TRINITY_DN1955_c0_g1_i3.p1 TRINITY_DN1955_c0_g1~~TRINITY_DN1955_c0_g1_i3.p1  ORF type:complete len:485 (-),score=96.98 TRINITY_DN1955_c0_g1_i3:78-1508(-)